MNRTLVETAVLVKWRHVIYLIKPNRFVSVTVAVHTDRGLQVYLDVGTLARNKKYENNSLPLSDMSFVVETGVFQAYVSFIECN